MSSVNDNNLTGGSSERSATPAPIDELQLQRYLDGRLDSKERAEVEDLLKQNAAARRTLDALREEESLLRDAFEPRVEASKRIGDKVLMTLHQEERFRINAERNRRLRRQVTGLMGAAATVVLCLWLIKPRDAAGTMISGIPATLTTSAGETRPLAKDTPVYEGDIISAAQGQFLRVQLSAGALLDIDERSKVEIERGPGVVLGLNSGRIGVDATHSRQDIVVHLPQGRAQIAAGALVDLWLPTPSNAISPSIFEPTPAQDNSGAPPTAVLTVIRGSAYLTTERYPEGLPLSAGQRSIFTPSSRSIRKIDISASRVLESRGDNGWHGSEGVGPRDRVAIGLLNPPSFSELGRSLKLTQKGVAGIDTILAQLDEAMKESNSAERARKLGAAQAELRSKHEVFPREHEGYYFGRTLEGLALIQHGRALVAAGLPAQHSFHAAAAAFDEALDPIPEPGEQPRKRDENDKPRWRKALLAEGITQTLSDLTPFDQSALISSFYLAVAQYWEARTAEKRQDLGKTAAREFQALRADRENPSHEPLGRSVELLAAYLGEALALEVAGERQKAIDVLQDLVSTRLAGMSLEPRRQADGIRQAALVMLTKLYANAGDMKQAQNAADDFWLLYPLDGQSPAAREIEKALCGELLRKADAALEGGQYQAAVDSYDELLASSQESIRSSIDLRMKLVRALIGARSGDRARQELELLSGKIPQQRRAEFESLQKEAKALPGSTPSRAASGLPALQK
ncbi:MAG TPA: hypothetical protein VEJ63_08560 [Planctomycetota bacterium]|nr:hypothetical protein [Planctomycetota bacterium]